MGGRREALVYTPPAAKTTSSPVVFAFHGHGGTMQHAVAKFAYPLAINNQEPVRDELLAAKRAMYLTR
jgi:hypothetical protein